MPEHCDSTQALAALTYLRHSFGGWEIPEAEQRSHLRTFRKATPAEITNAIESLKGSTRRPSPAEIESAIAGRRPKPDKHSRQTYLDDIPVADLTPADELPDLVAQLKDPTSDLRQGVRQ